MNQYNSEKWLATSWTTRVWCWATQECSVLYNVQTDTEFSPRIIFPGTILPWIKRPETEAGKFPPSDVKVKSA
jgi:hypothetical protein